MTGKGSVGRHFRVPLAASKLEFDILKLKHLKTMMDNKEFSLNVTLALESAFEASMGGEVPGT